MECEHMGAYSIVGVTCWLIQKDSDNSLKTVVSMSVLRYQITPTLNRSSFYRDCN